MQSIIKKKDPLNVSSMAEHGHKVPKYQHSEIHNNNNDMKNI